MGSLLTKVKAKMSIYAHQKVRGLLEGEYGSVFKGRSMDFDDLREYIPGDDIKDIDWKATARSGATRIRRYIAVRKHNILLVVDTGKNMTARTSAGAHKKDVAVMAAGTFAALALKHGDFVGMVCGDSENVTHVPFKSDARRMEIMLQKVDSSIAQTESDSSIERLLEFVTHHLRRKMIVVVITDDIDLDAGLLADLKRLRTQHEVLWVTVQDVDLTAGNILRDTEENNIDLPAFARQDEAVRRAYAAAETERKQSFQHSLTRLAIVSETVTSEDEVVEVVYRLLERHRHVRRT